MAAQRTTPERLAAFWDAIFAVIITIMVLDLRPPPQATLAALFPLWPTALSYAVSYLFIAIVGTHAAIPHVPGLEAARTLTNIEALDLDYLPPHLIVLGGGYVGLELARLTAVSAAGLRSSSPSHSSWFRRMLTSRLRFSGS
jgi:Endosomal/lysosomal potassium channel TMEM175/Pyridine nucleotide-disulphide oxidoreductase